MNNVTIGMHICMPTKVIKKHNYHNYDTAKNNTPKINIEKWKA